MPGGRPTTYKPEFCKIIEDGGNEGWHVEEMAHACDCSVSILYEWAKEKPEFLESFTRAKDNSRVWWLKKGRESLDQRDFQSKTYQFIVQAKFGLAEGRLIRLPALKEAKSFTEKANIVIDALASGEITGKEALDMVNVIAIGAKIEEVTELKATLERIIEQQNPA